MLKKVLIAALLLLLISLPGVVAAQDVPSGTWWKNEKFVQNLNLTPKEVRQLDRLWGDNHRKLNELRSAVKREQFELNTLLDKEPVDQPKEEVIEDELDQEIPRDDDIREEGVQKEDVEDEDNKEEEIKEEEEVEEAEEVLLEPEEEPQELEKEPVQDPVELTEEEIIGMIKQI